MPERPALDSAGSEHVKPNAKTVRHSPDCRAMMTTSDCACTCGANPPKPDLWGDLMQWSKMIANLPEPVAYIVLDPNWSPSLPHVDGHDARGRRYVLCSPAILDSMRHIKATPTFDPTNLLPPSLMGIPVYKRESMPEGWPDA